MDAEEAGEKARKAEAQQEKEKGNAAYKAQEVRGSHRALRQGGRAGPPATSPSSQTGGCIGAEGLRQLKCPAAEQVAMAFAAHVHAVQSNLSSAMASCVPDVSNPAAHLLLCSCSICTSTWWSHQVLLTSTGAESDRNERFMYETWLWSNFACHWMLDTKGSDTVRFRALHMQPTGLRCCAHPCSNGHRTKLALQALVLGALCRAAVLSRDGEVRGVCEGLRRSC